MGAGPNLIKGDLLPLNGHACARHFHTSVRSNGDTIFSAKGEVQIQVNISWHVVSTIFRFGLLLATEAILAMALTDEEMKQIAPPRRLNFPRKGKSTPILASLSKNVDSYVEEGRNQDCCLHIMVASCGSDFAALISSHYYKKKRMGSVYSPGSRMFD